MNWTSPHRCSDQRRCRDCGFPQDTVALSLDALPPRQSCPKCDANIYAQHDGSCWTYDIAHSQETVARALGKLDAALLEGWGSHAATLRLVVGGGAIRREILGQLTYYQRLGRLLAFAEDSPNRGAILLRLR